MLIAEHHFPESLQHHGFEVTLINVSVHEREVRTTHPCSCLPYTPPEGDRSEGAGEGGVPPIDRSEGVPSRDT